MKRIIFSAVLLLTAFATNLANATEYDYCITSNHGAAHLVVRSDIVDFGKEWYRVKSTMMYCQATNSTGCSASDYSYAQCGSLPPQFMTYTQVDGTQIHALFSGNPIVMAQTAVEVVTSVPTKTVVKGVNAVGSGLHKACKWIHHKC